MRCDSSEEHFEELLEGTLAPRLHKEVLAHLEVCSNCSSVLEELRVIDALLLTPRQLEPAGNFTFATMAEVRALPAPAVRRPPVLKWITAYLIGSWALLAAALLPNAAAARAVAGMTLDQIRRIAAGIDTLAQHLAGGHVGFGYVTTLVLAMLVLDVALAAAAFYAHGVLRPRLAARLGRSEA